MFMLSTVWDDTLVRRAPEPGSRFEAREEALGTVSLRQIRRARRAFGKPEEPFFLLGSDLPQASVPAAIFAGGSLCLG